jgi:hypothetical protein
MKKIVLSRKELYDLVWSENCLSIVFWGWRPYNINDSLFNWI